MSNPEYISYDVKARLPKVNRWPWRALIVWAALWVLAIGINLGLYFLDFDKLMNSTLRMGWGVDFLLFPFLLPLTILPVAFVALIIIGLAWIMQRVRRTRVLGILTYLEQAVRLNLPLSEYIHAAAHSEGRWMARRLEKLRDLLSGGHPVGVALAAAVPEIRPRLLGVLTAAEKSGTLAVSLNREIEHERTRRNHVMNQDMYLRFYPLFMLLAMGWLLTFHLIYVMPKFREIFHDFNVREPSITTRVMSFLYELGDDTFAWRAAVTLLILAVMGPVLIRIFAPADPRILPIRPALDNLAWQTPIWKWVVRDRAMADVFTVLADALAAGRPMTEALRDAAATDVNRVVQNRVATAAAVAETGRPLSESARQAHWPTHAINLLAAAEDSGSLPETCAFLARYYRSRFSRAMIFLRAAAEPAVALALGILVGTIAVALMMPLVEIIKGVLRDTGLL